jgi:hypothetical protein
MRPPKARETEIRARMCDSWCAAAHARSSEETLPKTEANHGLFWTRKLEKEEYFLISQVTLSHLITYWFN